MTTVNTTLCENWTPTPIDQNEAEETLLEYTRTLERLREIESEKSDELSRADLGRALRRFAKACRLVGEFDDALEAQDESVTIWTDLARERARVLAQIEAADIAHLAKAADAWKRFQDLQDTIDDPQFKLYADFYWEYRALAHCRDGELDRGLDAMRRALEIRIAEERKERQLDETRALISRIEDAMAGES